MHGQALFLDEGVVAHGIELKVGGQSDRPQRTVQSEGDVVTLRHGGDLAGLGDAACVGRVGLDDVHAAFAEDSLEVPAREEALAEGNGSAAMPGDFSYGLGGLAKNGSPGNNEF